jgi:hypothetical protein
MREQVEQRGAEVGLSFQDIIDCLRDGDAETRLLHTFTPLRKVFNNAASSAGPATG